jgi:hypothetical protein
MGVTTVEVPANHMAMVSHPGEALGLIQMAAKASAGWRLDAAGGAGTTVRSGNRPSISRTDRCIRPSLRYQPRLAGPALDSGHRVSLAEPGAGRPRRRIALIHRGKATETTRILHVT